MDGLYAGILRAATAEDTISAICGAPPSEVSTLPLDTIEAVLGAISAPSASPKHVIAQSKLLSGLPGALRATKVPLSRLLELYSRVVEFGGAQPDPRVLETRRSTLAELSELAATLVRDPAASVSLKALSPVIQNAPFPVVASIVAALGEKGADIEAVGEYAALVGGAPAESLAALPPETIVRLMVGSSKSGQVSRNVLSQVATAASTVLGTWGMDDVSKLLFAVAQVKDGATNAGVAELFRKASEVVAPQLASLSLTQLIKVVMAVSRVPASKPLLQAAAAVTAEKAAEVPAAQLIPLTQGLAPVGPADPSMARLLDFWASSLEGAATEKLSADQLAKLAQVLAPVAPSHAALWAGLGKRLSGQAKSLTAAGQASVSAAFPGGAGPDFEGKGDLLATVAKLQAPSEKDKRGDDDKRDRDRDRDRKGDRDDRGDRDRDRRSRERDRDRKDRSRSRRRR